MNSERHTELEARLHSAAEAEHLWESFIEHPGWSKFAAVLNEQLRLREVLLRQQYIRSVGEAFGQEAIKGEANGIDLALKTPGNLLEEARSERRLATKSLEIDDATEDEVSAADAERRARLDGNPFGGDEASGDDNGAGPGTA